jgi:hypothetical protein
MNQNTKNLLGIGTLAAAGFLLAKQSARRAAKNILLGIVRKSAAHKTRRCDRGHRVPSLSSCFARNHKNPCHARRPPALTRDWCNRHRRSVHPRGMFCPRHCDAQPNGPDDHALHLLQRSCSFKNAEGIRDSLSHLYSLLAADAISPRRAAVLGYLSSLLLRTLPAMYNDPYPKPALPCPPPN